MGEIETGSRRATDAWWDWSGLRLEATGQAGRVRHLRREFGAGSDVPGQADVTVRFGSVRGRLDRHKGTWWRMSVSSPAEPRIALSLSLHGLFADALVQSVTIEQALAIAAPDRGFALIPAAALRSPEDRIFVILGSAGAGKTSLALAALLGGWTMLADDHLLVDASGRCFGLPRRMRVYPSTIDLVRSAAPRLTPAERSALRLRRIARQLTAGRVGLPILVPPERFGPVSTAAWATPDRIIAIDRSAEGPGARWSHISGIEAVDLTLMAIGADRRRLAGNLGDTWADRLRAVGTAEREILVNGWRDVPAGHAVVPTSWAPDRILDWLSGSEPEA